MKDCNGRRVYDKQHACLFCGKLDAKIARHLFQDHENKEEIVSINKLDVKKKDEKLIRAAMLDDLRHRGDFYHNVKVLRTGGVLILWRRPAPDDVVCPNDYKPCPYCLVFVTKKEMWRHVKTCKKNNKSDEALTVLGKSEMLLYPNRYSEGASKELTQLVLSKMNNDSISEIVSSDKLITTFGSFLLSSHGLRKGGNISQRMRILARVLVELWKLSEEPRKTLLDFIKPCYFDNFVEVTRSLGGFSMVNVEGESIAGFKTPSLPLKIGYALQKCTQIKKGIGIKSGNSALVTDAEKFGQLYNFEWNTKIISISISTLSTNQFNKVQLLPLTNDLMSVRLFLQEHIAEETKNLNANPSIETWRCLAELSGIRITMFNRRRISEVFGMLMSRFLERSKWKKGELEEVKTSLTALEKQLMNR